jgi:hypothetical protein
MSLKPSRFFILIFASAGYVLAGDTVSADYSKAGFPFLEKHCTECHGDKVKKSGLSLLSYRDEAAVLKDRAVWKTALTMVLSGEMPPEKKPRPDPAEVAAFTRSVEALFEKGDRTAKAKGENGAGNGAGRVAMHRLNRNEYNNTVRDLLSIDFNAAEDFPVDEVGHGFDNISDVQWISPVHMERYLAAAESVAQRAIAIDPPKPPRRQQNARFLEPAGPSAPRDKFRMISMDGIPTAISSGPLNTPYKTIADGEYVFKARLYALPGSEKPPQKPAGKAPGGFFSSLVKKPETAKLPAQGFFGSIATRFAQKAGAGVVTAKEAPRAPLGFFGGMGEQAHKPAAKFDKTVRVAMLGCGASVPKPVSDDEAAKLAGVAVRNLRPFQILKIVEVKARNERDAEVIDFKIPRNFGLQRIAVAIVKPRDGGPPPRLYVEWLALEGPLDTRPPFQKKYMTCPPDMPRENFTREMLNQFVSKAYRRPAKPDEIERFVKLIDGFVARNEKWEAGVQLAIQMVLASPKFLFRPELEPETSGAGPQPLNDYELASRLSYFLWSSMPDDELFTLAAKKELSANLEVQVKRMLKDPKSKALTENFALQWLQLRRLNNVTPDAKAFPQFARVKPFMLEESTLFLDAIIKEDRSILDIIDGNFTFLNETLARHYGIVDSVGNRSGQKNPKPGGKSIQGFQFQRVELGENSQRGGLLTHASFLTVTSNPTRTSPVKRGKWVLDQLLGTPPPPPPPDVPDLDNTKELTGTLRQRMEQHRENPNCANCHARMDPIGFAFENYDAIGQYRTQDGGQNIDASGTLPGGQSFTGAAGLKEVLKKKKDLFSRCLTEKMLTFALGRGVEVYDNGSINRILEAMARDDYRFSTLVTEIAKSDAFRMRK